MKKDNRSSEEVIKGFIEATQAGGTVYFDMLGPRVIYNAIMRTFHREIVRHFEITDIFNGNTLRWTKRIIPLTDEELKEFYG